MASHVWTGITINNNVKSYVSQFSVDHLLFKWSKTVCSSNGLLADHVLNSELIVCNLNGESLVIKWHLVTELCTLLVIAS